MVYIPKQIKERQKDLEAQLNIAVMFNDQKRVTYINTQLRIIDDKINNREEANK